MNPVGALILIYLFTSILFGWLFLLQGEGSGTVWLLVFLYLLDRSFSAAGREPFFRLVIHEQGLLFCNSQGSRKKQRNQVNLNKKARFIRTITHFISNWEICLVKNPRERE